MSHDGETRLVAVGTAFTGNTAEAQVPEGTLRMIRHGQDGVIIALGPVQASVPASQLPAWGRFLLAAAILCGVDPNAD